MFKISLLLVLIVSLGVNIYNLINRIIRKIKKEKEEYKKLSEVDRTLMSFTSIAFIIPLIVFLIDDNDLLYKFNIAQNLTNQYDWLSFIATYSSAIIGAVFLLYVTRVQRDDNIENIRDSQRPYLNIDFLAMEQCKIKEKMKDNLYPYDNNSLRGINIPILKITNAGESVARIDVNKSHVKIKYEIIKDENEEVKETHKKILLNEIVKRLSIPAKETVYICFDNKVLAFESLVTEIEINECYIEYKDLFGCEYKDFSILENNIIDVKIDNELQKNIK